MPDILLDYAPTSWLAMGATVCGSMEKLWYLVLTLTVCSELHDVRRMWFRTLLIRVRSPSTDLQIACVVDEQDRVR